VAVKTVQPARTTAHFGPVIVIRRGANQLRYYQGARLVRLFGVATGQAIYPTPTGTFSIVDMQKNPWWLPPDSAWAKGEKPIPPGPGNPLGTRWMGLSTPGVGMHGTPDDTSIGYSASHGCIRLTNENVEDLYGRVTVGTRVIVLSGRNTVTSQLRPAHKPRAMRLLEQTSPSPGARRISPDGPKGSEILPNGPLDLPL
jgi:lipoprotein-anchoring transpeptidase ErfK/SrfK